MPKGASTWTRSATHRGTPTSMPALSLDECSLARPCRGAGQTTQVESKPIHDDIGQSCPHRRQANCSPGSAASELAGSDSEPLLEGSVQMRLRRKAATHSDVGNRAT